MLSSSCPEKYTEKYQKREFDQEIISLLKNETSPKRIKSFFI